MRGPFSKRPSGSNVSEPSLGDFIKSAAPQSENRGLSRVLFPAPNRHIDILRVKLDCSRASTCLFSSDKDCTTAAKGIENQTPSLRTILNRVRDHQNRLYRRVHGELIQAAGSHRVHTIVIPDVGSVAGTLSQLLRVPIRDRNICPYKNHSVLLAA